MVKCVQRKNTVQKLIGMGKCDEGIRVIIRKYFGLDRVNTEEVSEMGKAEKGKQYGRNNIMNGRREIL